MIHGTRRLANGSFAVLEYLEKDVGGHGFNHDSGRMADRPDLKMTSTKKTPTTG